MRSTQIIIVMVNDFLFRLIARGVFRLCQVYIWVAASAAVQEAGGDLGSSSRRIQAVPPLAAAVLDAVVPSLLKSFYLHNSWKPLKLPLDIHTREFWVSFLAKILIVKWNKSKGNKGKIIRFLLSIKTLWIL